MNIEIVNKLDEIINLIKDNDDYKRMKSLEEKLNNDKDLLSKIDKIKTIDNYSDEYIILKKEVLSNDDYKEYLELQKKYQFLIKDINLILNSLKEKSGC